MKEQGKGVTKTSRDGFREIVSSFFPKRLRS
jgi:hypothetical protein